LGACGLDTISPGPLKVHPGVLLKLAAHI
jgi:hypothetical protein